MTTRFYTIPLAELYSSLQSSDKGLSQALAAQRAREQANFFKQESRWKREGKLLARQFANPLQLLLFIAVFLSIVLGDSSDALIMLIILLITGILSFWQESNAGRALEKIRKIIDIKHSVLREGKISELVTAAVVPGDILLLDAGDLIPADCRILESNELHVNESILTGESFPVEKFPDTLAETTPLAQRHNCLWQGTNVISGTARALAVQTGAHSVLGEMTVRLAQTPETAFEKGFKRFGLFLLRITVILSLLILFLNLYFHKPFMEVVLFSLALAVGMAPELLPAILTFSMSSSAKRMMKKKVLIKKLSSVFNFGEVNVLCTDKTGTITEGLVTVRDIVDFRGQSTPELFQLAYLNATLQNGFENPIDKALASLTVEAREFEKINEIPYDFIRKRLSVAVQKKGQASMITKGAYTSVLSVCTLVQTASGEQLPLNPSVSDQLNLFFQQKSEEGFRVLGLATKSVPLKSITKSDEAKMIFLGFILLEDPLKKSSLDSIRQLEALQIEIKIITGDNPFAARHTARLLNLENPKILTGQEMDQLSAEALVVQARATQVFSEIEPHQKERIIKALQQSHRAVAYLGDGINDVAAINAADIGISTHNAVDVAKEAADFVLLENDLSVLADGVVEGRRSFANSLKYILITTGATFGNMISVAGASLLLPFLPMLPKQLLLNNLITDFPFLTISSDEVDPAQVKSPGKWNLKQLRNFMIVFGLHSSCFDFITFYLIYVTFQLSGSAFQTVWFLESACTEILILFVIRTRLPIWKSRPARWVTLSSLTALVVIFVLPLSSTASTLGFTFPGIKVLGGLLLILAGYFISAEILKQIFFRWAMRKS